MRYVNIIIILLCAAIINFPPSSNAFADDLPHPESYIPKLLDIENHKKFFDDPTPYLKNFGPRQVLPESIYAKLTYDVEEMKNLWAEVVGFRSPDLVEKIAPEIKPGTYTYKDLKKFPGLKKLMWKDLYNRIKEGGPPHAGSIPEFEIVSTRQYYWGLPIGEATKENMGKAKLDKNGYIITETWENGYPFPRPSGKFKAQQIMYNVEKRYLAWGLNFYLLGRVRGYTDDLELDFDGIFDVKHARLARRALVPPFGWYDDRAKDRGEFRKFLMSFLAPRDVAGTVQSALYYLDPNKMDQLMIYLPSIRRIRKMTSTDTQDPIMGQDQIYDDNEGFMQKLTPERYPYEYEVIAEREYLVPAPTRDGSTYISSDGLEFRNLKFERRPMYVVKLTQLDPNYVYGHRILYIDKETFVFYHVENYDQKGRLYRTWDGNYSFFPKMGTYSWAGSFILMRDHIDTHSSIEQPYQLPAFWDRGDLSLMRVRMRTR